MGFFTTLTERFGKKQISGALLLLSLLFSNFLNFVFISLSARKLSFENVGVVTVFITLIYLWNILFEAVNGTVSHQTAEIGSHSGGQSQNAYFTKTGRKMILLSIVLGFIWLAFAPFLSHTLQMGAYPIAFFSLVIFFGISGAVNRGFLNGTFRFLFVSFAVAIESVSKLIYAGLFLLLGREDLVYIAVPLSYLTSLFVLWLGLPKKITKESKTTETITKKAVGVNWSFLFSAMITTLAGTAFLSIDLLLAKAYLSSQSAGQYAMLSFAGKMIFFIGSLPNIFIIPLVSAETDDSKKGVFVKIFAINMFLVAVSFLTFGIFGKISMKILFGENSLVALPYLGYYALAISFFTIANSLITYRLAKKQFLFPIMALGMSVSMIIGIMIFHKDISSIVQVLFWISMIYLALVIAFGLRKNKKRESGLKKILIFNWRDIKHKFAGGAEMYIHELAKRWISSGYEVTQFSGNDGQRSNQETVDGVKIFRRGNFYTVYFWAFLYYFARFRGKFDVIIDSQNGLPFFTALYAKERTVCLMHHVHQKVFSKYLPKPMAVLAKFLEAKVMPFVCRKCRFITVSESSKKDMLEIGIREKQISIFSPGVDLSFFKPGKKSSFPLVLYLGRLKAYKSIDVLIRAFKTVSQKIPSARLVIAGFGDERDNLEKLVSKLGLSEKVSFPGKVSEKEKLALFQQAWVMVNPSIMEGWGITIIEANACGTPVIASDVPGLRDSVINNKTGYLFPYGNEKQLATLIVKVVKENNGDLSNQSLAWSKKFDWNEISKKMLEFLDWVKP